MQKDIYNLDIVISDTSSLSNLTNIRRLDLLKSLYNNIIITKEVSDEYKKEYKEKLPNWIIVKEVKNKENIIDLRKKTKYGLGEISSIVYALENPNTLIIIDDQKPKMFALDLGLHVIGSIGVIRQAVDKNVIKSKEEANMLFDEIKNTGGWISDKFLKNIKYSIDDEENIKKLEAREKAVNNVICNMSESQKITTKLIENLHGTTKPEIEKFWPIFWKKVPVFIKEIIQDIRKSLKNNKDANNISNNINSSRNN